MAELKIGDLVVIHHKRWSQTVAGVVIGIKVNQDNLLEYLVYREDDISWWNGLSLWPAVWTFAGPVVIERCALGLRSGPPTEQSGAVAGP